MGQPRAEFREAFLEWRWEGRFSNGGGQADRVQDSSLLADPSQLAVGRVDGLRGGGGGHNLR